MSDEDLLHEFLFDAVVVRGVDPRPRPVYDPEYVPEQKPFYPGETD